MTQPLDTSAERSRLREATRNRRASRSAQQKQLADEARTCRLLDLLSGLADSKPFVACYLATQAEPDTLAFAHAWSALPTRSLIKPTHPDVRCVTNQPGDSRGDSQTLADVQHLDRSAAHPADDPGLLVPIFTDWRTSRTPQWALWRADEPLAKSFADIPVPADATPATPAQLAAVDVIIISGLLADQHGNRLGTGGGWFDRTLPRFRRDAVRICLLNDDEIVNQLNPDPHDEPVDVLITQSQTIVTHARV